MEGEGQPANFEAMDTLWLLELLWTVKSHSYPTKSDLVVSATYKMPFHEKNEFKIALVLECNDSAPHPV